MFSRLLIVSTSTWALLFLQKDAKWWNLGFLPSWAHISIHIADLLSSECSGPAVHSVEPVAPPQDQTVCALGCVSWRTPHLGSGRCRGLKAGWPSPSTSPAGWGWDAEDRVSDRLRGWRCYTPRTLRQMQSVMRLEMLRWLHNMYRHV